MGAQRTVRETWRRHIVELLDQTLERNDAAISGVADAITTTILAGRHVYAFGAGHSLALVSEMHRRAGGMKVVRPLWNAELTSRVDAVWAEAGERLAARGHVPEVWGSANRGPV
ncbi:MAG TPA: SIS domain-containing protein [Streptosporangiaceae bacterium]|nr:SIS domain-containing protein [Streptosporangiaceae bacterium]